MNPEPDVVNYLQQYYKGGSVLDIGAGNGRYRSCFGDDYTAIDLLPRRDNKEFIQADFTRFKPARKYDYLFCSVVLEQVGEIPEITTWAKTILMVEPTTLNGWDGATLRHNYLEDYKPTVKEPMKNGATFMVIKGTK